VDIMVTDRIIIERNTASNVKKSLNDDVKSIKDTLRQMERTAKDNAKEWWKGPSSIRFIARLFVLRVAAEKMLDAWMTQHVDLVKEIVARKIAQEQEASQSGSNKPVGSPVFPQTAGADNSAGSSGVTDTSPGNGVSSEMTERIKIVEDTYKNGDYWNKEFGGAWQCMGFSFLVLNDLYPGAGFNGTVSHANMANWNTHNDVTALKPGDYVRYNTTSQFDHSIVILEVNGNTIRYIDSNGLGNNKVSHGTMTLKQLQDKIDAPLVDNLKDINGGQGFIKTYQG